MQRDPSARQDSPTARSAAIPSPDASPDVLAPDSREQSPTPATELAGRIEELEDALQRSRAQLSQVLTAASAIVHDFNVAVEHSGSSESSALDSAAATSANRTWQDLVHPDDAPKVRAELAAAIERNHDGFTSHYRIRDRRGKIRVVRDRVAIDRDRSGRVVSAHGIAIDITDRQRREDRASQLQELTTALSTALDPEGVGAAIIERAMPALGANAGNVFLLDACGHTLRNLALLGYDEKIKVWSQNLPVAGETMVAEVVRTGQPILMPTWAERLERYPHHRDVHAHDGDRAVAGLPLQVEGRLIGALSLAFPTDRDFDEDDRRFMTTIADLCAQALERARLYEAVQTSETRFRQLADSMPQIAWAMSGGGETLEYLNERWFDYTGQDPGLGIATPIYETIHPHDLEFVNLHWAEARESGTPFHGELRLRGRDGQYR